MKRRVVHAPEPPTTTGSSLLIDVSPTNRPQLAASYGIEVLDRVEGKRCLTRSDLDTMEFWIARPEIDRLADDELTRQVIAAAAYDAIAHVEDADTILITRVIADGKSSDRVCATVYGRGVRLTVTGLKSEPADDLAEP